MYQRALAIAVAALAFWGAWFWYHRPAPEPVAEESDAEKSESVLAAFDSKGEPVDDAEVSAFVEAFHKAVRSENEDRITAKIDVERMLQATHQVAGTEPSRGSAWRAMVDGAKQGIGRNFANLVERYEIRAVDRDDKNNVVVYLRGFHDDGYVAKMRWWLFDDGDGLRLWDFEDLDLGLRATRLMAPLVTTPDVVDKLQPVVTMIRSMQTLDLTDMLAVAQVRQQVDAIDTKELPAELVKLVLSVRAGLAVTAGDAEEALGIVSALERYDLRPMDYPARHAVRANASIILERWDDAVKAAETYLETLGEDSDVLVSLGVAKSFQEDTKGAEDAFKRAIADNPANPLSYAYLATVSEDAALLDEVVPSIPSYQVLSAAMDSLVADEAPEGIARLRAAVAKAHPDWDLSRWPEK